MNAKTEVGDLALSRLGTGVTVNDIDNPKTPAERVISKWYDLSRQTTLKTIAPNFSLKRTLASKSTEVPAFGPAYCYEKPIDCLRVLGIGEIQDKENTTSVEGDYILSDDDYADGMPIRYVKDITDVAKFTPDFISLLAWQLAYDICLEITKDYEKLSYIEKVMPSKLSHSGSLNGLENRPIRINKSKFKSSRTAFGPVTEDKR
jgi:hypothetical protein